MAGAANATSANPKVLAVTADNGVKEKRCNGFASVIIFILWVVLSTSLPCPVADDFSQGKVDGGSGNPPPSKAVSSDGSKDASVDGLNVLLSHVPGVAVDQSANAHNHIRGHQVDC